MEQYNGSAEIIQEMTDLLKQKQISASAALKMMLKLEMHDLKIRQEMSDRIADNKAEIEKVRLDYEREVALLKRVGVGYSIYNNPRRATLILLALYSLGASGLIADIFNWVWQNFKLLF